MLGIARSRIAMSGRRRSASAVASRPSDASATTSKPARSSNARTPWRTICSSSASKTRRGTPEGYPGNPAAKTGNRPDRARGARPRVSGRGLSPSVQPSSGGGSMSEAGQTTSGNEGCPVGSRVLLADDHSVVRKALRLLLEREGFQVVAEASDGLEAIRAAHEFEPEIAILDLAMPLVNGIEAAREIRAGSPRTTTVLLFGNATDAQMLDALRAGVQACVLKTCEAEELIGGLREVARGGVYLSRGLTSAVVDAYRANEDL